MWEMGYVGLSQFMDYHSLGELWICWTDMSIVLNSINKPEYK